MTQEEALYQARMLSETERKILLLCRSNEPSHYAEMAREIGEIYKNVQTAGRRLQALKLARIGLTVRPSIYRNRAGEYAGSALFLTDLGVSVRLASVRLMNG